MPSGCYFSLGLMDGSADRALEFRVLSIYTIPTAHREPSGAQRLWDVQFLNGCTRGRVYLVHLGSKLVNPPRGKR